MINYDKKMKNRLNRATGQLQGVLRMMEDDKECVDVIAAISYTDGLLIAVQWHPENMWQRDEKQLALFENFIKKC